LILATATLALAAGLPPRVVLLTMDAGDDLFSKSGHAALCIMPGEGNESRAPCYNYGITHFDDPPGLVFDYARGRADFWVVVFPYQFILNRYTNEYDRTVWRQDVPMPTSDAAALYADLQWDALPANRHYAYHHFYDNCTTRIRDRLDAALHGKLRAGRDSAYVRTWRSFAEESLSGEPLLLAASTFVGRAADVHPTQYQALARPEVLRAELRAILGPGAEATRAYARRAPMPSGSPMAGRWLLATIAAAIALVTGLLSRWRLGAVRVVAPGIPGLIGVTLWSLAAVSVHDEFRWNEALLLFTPTDLALAWRRTEPYHRAYLLGRAALVTLALALDLAGVFHQPLFTLATLLAPLALLVRNPRASNA
jgi:hypothetical protein